MTQKNRKKLDRDRDRDGAKANDDKVFHNNFEAAHMSTLIGKTILLSFSTLGASFGNSFVDVDSLQSTGRVAEFSQTSDDPMKANLNTLLMGIFLYF